MTTRRSLSYADIDKGEPIGSGGNADVYRGTTTTDGEIIDIALKEPRMGGTLHTETVDRMMQEAETWQQLGDHDHIVSVVDYGSEPLPWIAMEYMDADHLGDRAGGLELDQALWTAIVTTKAVRHAHRRGIAHLDLKPANVLFRSVEDAWDVPKVADWGLSKHLLNHSKSVEGMSVEYAAPEQFDDEYGAVDDITDVYQLWAVFYELFTGRPPFEGKPFKVMNRIQTEEPEPPSSVADVPADLDEILLRAMATEKADRYETVIYLRDEFQQLRNDLNESGQL
jgi:serine/threonine protein kinase